MENTHIRWKQRFQNFQKAFFLLREALEIELEQLSQLEKEGIIQRFEYTFELAWKCLKDKMEFDGIVFDKIAPKPVIRQAFEAKYITNPAIWMKMIGDRNLMSHTYDFKRFEEVIESMKKEYLPILSELYRYLLEQSNA